MKKLSAFFSALFLCFSAAFSQTPVMTMTTSKAIGSDFTFSLIANAPGTTVKVDFGNGTLIDKTVDAGNLITGISGTLIGSQTVKVYGAGIIYLNCNNSQVTALDVSKNTALEVLFCINNQLTAIDVSKNTALKGLSCSKNRLTTLDVSKDLAMTDLWCSGNQLTNLDVSHNTSLTWLWCESNNFTYATLPIKRTTWDYKYAPQKSMPIAPSSGTGIELDLSSQLTVNANTTGYTWKTNGSTTLVQGTDYTLTNGKTVFLKAQTDSVYCEMTNATFPDFTGDVALKTTCTKVSGTVGMEENAAVPDVQVYARNKTIYIDAPANGQAAVYDINGRLVADREILAGENTIEMQKSGVFLVRFTWNKASGIKKVFIGN